MLLKPVEIKNSASQSFTKPCCKKNIFRRTGSCILIASFDYKYQLRIPKMRRGSINRYIIVPAMLTAYPRDFQAGTKLKKVADKKKFVDERISVIFV